MATKPELRRAVANAYIKASDYNYNFDQLNNYIENGIADNAITNYENDREFPKGQWVLAEVGGEFGIYESEVDGNKGNSLLDKTYWKKVNLGAGLEIGDIGIAPLGIDETKGKRRYLNGQIVIQEQYIQFTNKLKAAINLYPSLACSEADWQATALLTVGGQVGKFVVDDDAGTIRLPKIIMPIQGLTDLSKLAEIVEAGLPNITGSIRAYVDLGGDGQDGANEALYTERTGVYYSGGTLNGTTDRNRLSFDASRSSDVYGNSNTVQQEQIQYPYFIQVATGAETEDNIVNEIELNNPFSLLDYKFSEYELNNLSWLRSQGQYNSKAVYPAVYDLLLKIYNGTETKAGVSVKLSTEEYTDYDFILNTSDETFRLPVSVSNSAQGYLYFYVGETVQNANLINAGRIEEHLHSLIPDNSSVIAGYGIPDYSAQIILDSGAGEKTYVAPSKGWFGYNFIMEGNNTGYVKVNDIQVISNRPAGMNHYDSVSGLIPIDSGDVVKYYTNVGDTGHRFFNFYPMKGAN